MGLFDFLKPKKSRVSEIMQKPAMRNAMAGLELEYLQKKSCNLCSVGRKDDAKKAITDFLAGYVEEGSGESASRLELARISYLLAYKTLPTLIYSRWSEFLDFWSGGFPFSVFLAIKGASDVSKRLTLDQIEEFKYYQGNLTTGLQYFLIEYPIPPEQGERSNMDAIQAALAKGQKPSPDSIQVLGPFFSVLIFNASTNDKYFYVLGQNPARGTTLRFVGQDGSNANCGPGPEPSAGAFLEAVKVHLKLRGK